MTFAGLLVLSMGLVLMTLAIVPWLKTQTRGRKLHTFGALRHPNFRWFWINGIAQAMAQGMQFLVLGWLILELTGSAYQLGGVIFVYGMTNLAFALFGGILADRIDRLKLLIVTRVMIAIPILILATLTVSDRVEIWHIYAISLILGTIQALNQPVRLAFVADLVERGELMNAVSLHNLVNQTGQIIGPAVAGGFIELAGLGPTLFLDAGLYLFGILFLLLIRGLQPKPAAERTSLLRDLVTGFQFIRSTPVIYTIIGIALAFGFFGVSHRQILPAFMMEVLQVGAGGTGLLMLSAGVGALIGSLFLASLGEFQRKARLLMVSTVMIALLLVLFAWSVWYWASWVIFLFVGVATFGLFWPLVTTLVQLNVPPELRGRVMSYLQLVPAVHHLGALPLAAVAAFLSWPGAITASAVVFLAITLWLGVARPTLRRLSM